MSRLGNCPECGKVISLAFPIHECAFNGNGRTPTEEEAWRQERREQFARVEERAYRDACWAIDHGEDPARVERELDLRLERVRRVLLVWEEA